jgi:glucokinase
VATEMRSVGIDLGGTYVRIAVLEAGRVLRDAKEPWPTDGSPDDDIEFISRLVSELAPSAEVAQSAVGVAVGGLLDVAGVVLEWPNRKAWIGTPFRSKLEAALGVSVVIDDDANCAAVAEKHFGAARPFRHALVLTLGTGVGAGLILDSELFRGSRGWAGELGHITAWPQGPECGCGRRGCLQVLASGRAMELVARSHGVLDLSGMLIASARDEPWATDALSACGRWVGAAAATAVNLLDLEAVVVGGGLGMTLPEPWWSSLRHGLTENVLAGRHRTVFLERAMLGEHAGVVGAAFLATRYRSPQLPRRGTI